MRERDVARPFGLHQKGRCLIQNFLRRVQPRQKGLTIRLVLSGNLLNFWRLCLWGCLGRTGWRMQPESIVREECFAQKLKMVSYGQEVRPSSNNSREGRVDHGQKEPPPTTKHNSQWSDLELGNTSPELELLLTAHNTTQKQYSSRPHAPQPWAGPKRQQPRLRPRRSRARSG